MNKSFFIAVITILCVFTKVSFSQNSNSMEISGGLFMPMNSSKGFNTSVQYNYNYSENIQFYVYSGYSSWDKFNVAFMEDLSIIQKQALFKTYNSDEHILIPVYIGSRINIHTNKFFTSFATFEIGYSYLSYNNYEIKQDINPTTGAVLSYNPDLSTKKEVKENLFGVGAGIGLYHPITENINVILAFKLNVQLNSKYYNVLNSKGIYTSVNLGFNFSI